MNEYGFSLKRTPAHYFVGRKPAAVLFGDERVPVKKWTDVYRLVYERVNQSPQAHEDLMYLRNKVGGNVRIFISDSPTGMRKPHKVDDSLYIETNYGTETMWHIMVDLILRYVRYDISGIRIVLKE
jgi:hypothetical protein